MAKDMWDMFKGVGKIDSLDWTGKKRRKKSKSRRKTSKRSK